MTIAELKKLEKVAETVHLQRLVKKVKEIIANQGK